MTYKEALTQANSQLADDNKKQVPASQIVETPVAENLMIGLAIGMALKGLKPVVFIERMDFILNALDSIVNHLDKIKMISGGEFSPAAIIRVVVGNKNKPLYTGITHVQDHSAALRHLVSFPVVGIRDAEAVAEVYAEAKACQNRGVSTIIVEYKDLI
jgi:pyruvate/2-oxoglutarate/acetoin dehydrogenase E1 component